MVVVILMMGIGNRADGRSGQQGSSNIGIVIILLMTTPVLTIM